MKNLVTFIGRVSDGMFLVATLDSGHEVEDLERHAKRIIRALSTNSPSKCTITAGPFFYHYMIENGVCYLTAVDKSFPKRLAFLYLEELCREFEQDFAADVPLFSRPYQAINFDPKMNRIRREYIDPHSTKHLQKLNTDLSEIHNIMVENIQEVLRRGENLENVQMRTSHLLSESKKFEKSSKYIRLQHLWKTWAPIISLCLIVLFFVYWKLFR